MNVKNDVYFDKDLKFVPNREYFPYTKNQVKMNVRERECLDGKMTDFGVKHFDSKSSFHWNEFYNSHKQKPYKDRYWLLSEFSSFFANISDCFCLHLGCGFANEIVPLLSIPGSFCFGVDFSKVAIENASMRIKSLGFENRCSLFVGDICSLNCYDNHVREKSVDFCFGIFCLSAINPKHHRDVFKMAFSRIKKGGYFFFRDFTETKEDVKFLEKKNGVNGKFKTMSDNYFLKGDNTTVYYFKKEMVLEMLIEFREIVEIVDIVVKRRDVDNYKEGIHKARDYLQFICKKI